MLKITWEALPSRRITILFIYIYFYQNRLFKNFSLPQGETGKGLKSSWNRKLSGVAGVPSVTLDKRSATPPVGRRSSGALGSYPAHGESALGTRFR